MADEQYKWLNRVTAERLLRGESLEAVDASARDQAERLAETLGALSARATPAAAELPGEEAALAAFRKARESAEDARTADQARTGAAAWPGTDARGADAGLFRIGRTGTGSRPVRAPGWARPARLGLAAALTVGMLGGVAVAAGTGVLPTPFDDNHPGPAASVSAAGTPARPHGSQSPESLLGGETRTPSSGAASAGSGQPSPDPSGRSKRRDTGSTGVQAGGWSGALTSCRAIRNGKTLGADRRRALEGLAGGAARVDTFCKAVLGTGLNGRDGVSRDGKGGDSGQNDGQGDHNGPGGDGEGWPGRGNGGGKGDGKGDGRGDGHHQDGLATPAPTALAPLRPNQPGASPSPTYSAL
ncbi:MAG: hypothetical protein JF597_03585 [Streptomyces sp.]|uniref:hypothetical protein n=1 Tax=Streptomyces sp. TaxID=1931 RepID=UPI0025FDF20B|nr:hypothetical protein [Streptomyces sp.]MBW8792685.1 hypothetical protein [Streptomyces sp.]